MDYSLRSSKESATTELDIYINIFYIYKAPNLYDFPLASLLSSRNPSPTPPPLPVGPRTLAESYLFCRLPPPLWWCLVAKSCMILCDPTDCSPPGSSIYGISQARILEWVVISFSRGIFPTQGWNPHLLLGRWILTTEPPGKSSPAHPYMLEGSTFCSLP